MERRKAITTAAAASLTLVAGAAGMALNSGIVGASGDGKVGQLTPITIAADSPVTTTQVAPAPLVQPTDTRPVAASSASSYANGPRDGEHERDGHEYEGAEDDD